MGDLVGDRGISRNTDAGDRQVSLRGCIVCLGADHMLQQINRVVWQGICVYTLLEGDHAGVNRPHIDATVGPIGKHDV